MKKLTSDTALATSIQSLFIDDEPVDFGQVHDLLKRLPNIKRLRMTCVAIRKKYTAEQMCKALNQLPRLCSLQFGCGDSIRSSCATCLLSRLKCGSIEMPKPTNAKVVSAATFAYKLLKIRRRDISRKEWSKFSLRCTTLAYLTIKEVARRRSHLLTIPASVVALEVFLHSDLFPMQEMQQTCLLKRLMLKYAIVEWEPLVVFCPNIRHLQLDACSILDVKSAGGPLKAPPRLVLQLISITHDEDSNTVLSHMSIVATSHLSIHCDYVRNIDYALSDWSAMPACLVGCHVVFDDSRRSMQIECRLNNLKRVALFCQLALL